MPLLRQGTAGRPAAIERLEGRRLLSATLTTLATFATATGGDPNGGLIADAAGDLFGTAMYGGPASAGTVFEIAAGSGTVTPLAAFGGTNGQDPAGGLAMDAAGDLFGTTELGGTDNDGTVFEVPAGGGGIVTLASFDGTDGSLPQGTPHLDAAGDLYGTAEDGGAGMAGTVFEVVAGSGAITTLASFPGYPSAAGAQPRAGVVADAAGDLFGTTYQGGAGGQGTLFEVAEGSGTVRGLASFNGPGAGTNGALALGELTLDASGDLFGTASQGGADDDGAVFEYAPATATLTTVASFDGADGKAPQGGLTADAAGDLFGSTAVGGANALGTVFEIPAGSGAVTTLVSFGGPDGSGPYGGLHLDAAGNLFGATEAGGPMGNGHIDQDLDGFGVAFEVSPGGATPTPTPTPTPTSTASPLVPTSGKSTVPAELVVGAKLKGKVTVTLTNGGGSTLKGTDVVSLYAVGADQAATAGTLVGTTRAKPTLAAGRSATVGVAVRPVAVPAGSYTLSAVVTDAAGAASTAATGPAVTVAPATVALSATVTAKPTAVAPGQAVAFTLVVTNGGNVKSAGAGTVAVYLSVDGTTRNVAVGTARAAPTIRPGRSATVRVKFKVAATTAAGLYPLAVFTQGGSTATAVGTSTVTVG